MIHLSIVTTAIITLLLMETHTLTQADHTRQITVQVGDTIRLQLAENPTTGYRWAIDSVNSAVLPATGDAYTANADAMVGGGGSHEWLFRGLQPGQTVISLKRWRDWEGDASVTERFSVTVRVQD